MKETNIPTALKNADCWICYGNKKVPKNPKTGKNLTGPHDTWGCSLEDAKKGLKKFKLSGLGFVFKSTNDFCGIDIDHCVNEGKANAFASALIEQCNSYTEVSPSGKGIHIIVKHKTKEKLLLKTGDIEVYNQGRYFTFTGNSLTGKKAVSKVNLNKFIDFKKKEVTAGGLPVLSDSPKKQSSVDSIIQRIHTKGSAKLRALYAGDWEALYDSQSEADFALCHLLRPFANTKSELDSLFRASGLMRKKWDRSVGRGVTYAEATIEKVFIGASDVKVNSDFVVELDAFVNLKLPNVNMIMAPWLFEGSTHILYAERGVGKTFLAISLSLAVAYATDFGDWEVVHPVNTLYVDGEMLPQQMVERIKGLKVNLKSKVKNWYILSSGINLQRGEAQINIANEHWQNFIYKEVQDKKVKFLILDNISALTSGIEENDSTAWDKIATWLNVLKHSGCAVLLVHHSGKGGKQRGTSSREDGVDTVIHLKRTSSKIEDGMSGEIIFEKARAMAGVAVSACNFKIVSEPGSSDMRWQIGSSNNARISATLKMLTEGNSYKKIKDALQISTKTIKKYKDQGIKDTWVVEKEGKLELTNLGRMMVGTEEAGETDY